MDIFLALIPIISIVLFLFVFNMPSQRAGIIAFFLTIVIAFIYAPNTSLTEISFASFHGVLISLVIIYVLFFGILMFNLLSQAGFIEKISDFVLKTTADPARQVIILAIAFSPLIESVSGFGIGVIVIAPILVALGFRPYQAALISLVSLSAVPWGALATGTVIGAGLTGMSLQEFGVGSAILSIPTFIFFAFVAIYMVNGWKAVSEKWGEVLVVSLALAAGVLISNQWFSVELAGVIGAIVALLVEGIFIYFSQKARQTKKKGMGEIIRENMFIVKILLPYLFLTFLLIVTRTIPTLEQFLTSFGVIAWERYDYELAIFYSPGFFLLVTCLFTMVLNKTNWNNIKQAMQQTTKQLMPVAITTFTFIALAQIMMEVNMMNTLAQGLGVLVGTSFIWVSPLIGAFSGMITGSNAASNAMFLELQTSTAMKYDLSTNLVASIQNTSASHMTMASPSRVLLAATITGSLSEERKIFKTMVLIVGIALAIMMLFGYLLNISTNIF